MPRPAGILSKIGGHFRGRIISGLLILLPLVATYLIIKFFLDLIDTPVGPLIRRIFGRDIPVIDIVIIEIVIIIVVLYLVGWVGSYVIGRRLRARSR